MQDWQLSCKTNAFYPGRVGGDKGEDRFKSSLAEEISTMDIVSLLTNAMGGDMQKRQQAQAVLEEAEQKQRNTEKWGRKPGAGSGSPF